MLYMSRLRTIVAWLVMATIPLQGLAAVSMLFCGMGAHHASSEQGTEVSQAPALHVAAAAVAHEHANHSHAEAQPGNTRADTSGAQLPDASHKCGVCASCCHSVAIAEYPQLVAFAPAPQADLIEPFVLIQARPSPVPDKPPRA
jgi:hypothetical protein